MVKEVTADHACRTISPRSLIQRGPTSELPYRSTLPAHTHAVAAAPYVARWTLYGLATRAHGVFMPARSRAPRTSHAR